MVPQVNEAEEERLRSEREHQRVTRLCQQAEARVQGLQKSLKRAIVKSKPYFELKARFNQVLEVGGGGFGGGVGGSDVAGMCGVGFWGGFGGDFGGSDGAGELWGSWIWVLGGDLGGFGGSAGAGMPHQPNFAQPQPQNIPNSPFLTPSHGLEPTQPHFHQPQCHNVPKFTFFDPIPWFGTNPTQLFPTPMSEHPHFHHF